MENESPIKIRAPCLFIDSGIGGLPYLEELKRLSSEMPCIYVADNANFPYGEKTTSDIYDAAAEIVKKAIWRFHPAVIVLACNTMSVSVLRPLRKKFPALPFVGTVPAIKKAAAVSKNKVIGILGSSKTIKSRYTAGLIAEFASDCKVIRRKVPRLIRDIEMRLIFAEETTQFSAVLPYVQPFIVKGADTVVLGCTHFLHLRSAFRKALDPAIQVVDSLDGVAQQALRLIQEKEGAGALEGRSEYPFDRKEPDRKAGDYFFLTKKASGMAARVYSRCRELYKLEWGGLF